MSYSAFYSAALSIRSNLQALDANAKSPEHADAGGAPVCQREDSDTAYGRAGAKSLGGPATNPEGVRRGYPRYLADPFEF